MKCTTPWLLRVSRELFGDHIEICSGNKSYEAAAFYVENRLPNFEDCNNPCTSMEIVSSMKMMKNSMKKSTGLTGFSMPLPPIIKDGYLERLPFIKLGTRNTSNILARFETTNFFCSMIHEMKVQRKESC